VESHLLYGQNLDGGTRLLMVDGVMVRRDGGMSQRDELSFVVNVTWRSSWEAYIPN
jgi:hypothetical protein